LGDLPDEGDAMVSGLFSYPLAYLHAVIHTIIETVFLTWRFITVWVGVATLAVAVIAEILGVRREMARTGEPWWMAVRNIRERISDGGVALLWVFSVVLIINLVRAPVIIWRESLQQADGSARANQKTADQQEYQQQLADAQVKLNAEAQAQPQAYLGVIDPKLIVDRRKENMRITVTLKNFSQQTSADDVVNSSGVTVGSGKDQVNVSMTIGNPMRLNPLQAHKLEINMNRRGDAPNGFVRLYNRQQPLVFELNLYYTVNTQFYSQREVMVWDYVHPGWNVVEEHLYRGAVALPAGVRAGKPVYWTAPWLPPVACPPSESVAAKPSH
jgi:hypothetical protein